MIRTLCTEEDIRNDPVVLVWKPNRYKPVTRPTCEWEDEIKVELNGNSVRDFKEIKTVQNSVKCQALGENDKNLGCIGRVEIYVIKV